MITQITININDASSMPPHARYFDQENNLQHGSNADGNHINLINDYSSQIMVTRINSLISHSRVVQLRQAPCPGELRGIADRCLAVRGEPTSDDGPIDRCLHANSYTNGAKNLSMCPISA